MDDICPPVRSHYWHEFDLEYHGELTDETSKVPDKNRRGCNEGLFGLIHLMSVPSCVLVSHGHSSEGDVVSLSLIAPVPVHQKCHHLL